MTSKAKAVVFSIAIICTCIVACIWAPAKDACKCESCTCESKWRVQGQINVKVIDHLRRNGVNIGDAAPVGSAK